MGLDISKDWFDAAATVDGEKKMMMHRRFGNNEQGFKTFTQWLDKVSKSLGAEGDCFVCMEHTGVYTLELCVFLEGRSVDYIVESALRIKRSLGIRRGKDDKADSMDIAAYVQLRYKKLKKSSLPSAQLLQLKALLSHRALLVKQRTAMKNAMGAYGKTPERYALESIKEDQGSLIGEIEARIKKAEGEMERIIASDGELSRLFGLVTSVKGVGAVIGTTMLVFTNGFTAFDSAKKFACYIGVAPFRESSGKQTGTRAKVSHLGYKSIKALLGNGANAAIMYDGQIKAYYRRKIAEGKNKFSVLNAVKNKLIARIFATVDRGTPYVALHGH